MAVRIVQHRVLVDDVDPTGTDDLNLRFKAAFNIVKLGRLPFLRPRLSLGDVGEVYDRALDSLIGANPDLRLLAGASAGLHILGRNYLSCRHFTTIDDDPFKGSASATVPTSYDCAGEPASDTTRTASRPNSTSVFMFTATPQCVDGEHLNQNSPNVEQSPISNIYRAH